MVDRYWGKYIFNENYLESLNIIGGDQKSLRVTEGSVRLIWIFEGYYHRRSTKWFCNFWRHWRVIEVYYGRSFSVIGTYFVSCGLTGSQWKSLMRLLGSLMSIWVYLSLLCFIGVLWKSLKTARAHWLIIAAGLTAFFKHNCSLCIISVLLYTLVNYPLEIIIMETSILLI